MQRRLGVRGSPRRAFLIKLGIAGLVGCSDPESAQKFQSADISGADWGQGFELTDHRGRQRRFGDFRGKVVLLYFGYTHCPDVCPVTLAKMADAVAGLGAEGHRVQGLFVTLDPERDTQAVLARYVPAFNPAFLGLYGRPAQIAAIAKNFKIAVSRRSFDGAKGYAVEHSSAIFVFDKSGRLRLYINGDIPTDAIVHDIRMLLAEAT